MHAHYVFASLLLLAGIGSSIGVSPSLVWIVFLLGMEKKVRIVASAILHLIETWIA